MNKDSKDPFWRPLVEPTQTHLPRPGSLNLDQQEVYTKTSLTYSSAGQSAHDQQQQQSLNKEILNASQAYNNTPKPFKRSETARLSSLTSPSFANQLEYPAPRGQFSNRSASLDQSQHQKEHKKQEENMAPKLVHKQYNSPIDMYSMNNIRKTIEAHTELIAPGIKGINFMKADAPVNKQSEVYKLVMEEEERARSQQGSSSRLSPISGQPLSIPTYPTSIVADRAQQKPAKQVATRLSPQPYQASALSPVEQQQCQQPDTQFRDINATGNSQQGTRQSSQVPTCCECGQFILGPFAKIQNKFIHPQCFNCTTCGTSLKNTGYFTVNEKLYCDIHARQVANMMHIKYDFDKDEHKSHSSSYRQHQVVNQSMQSTSRQLNSNKHEEPQNQSQLPITSSLNQFHKLPINNTSPATISTMFADRSGLCSDERRQDTTWSWRPVTNTDQTSSATSTHLKAYMRYANQQEQNQSQLSPNSSVTTNLPMSRQQQQQSIMSMETRGRGLLKESPNIQGGRIPICIHCHVQIQGPYILAGKTTWCRTCSQTNFNCSSCRRSLLDIGFIQDNSNKYYCENCFEAYYAPICSKCNIRIKGDCLNALGKQWHPSCFVCGHCRRPFGNSSFYLEDNLPYCERDWNVLFTTKCYACSFPIEAGDKWILALERNYHSNCFRCSSCQTNLEGSTFYCKGGKPYCRSHAR